MDIQSGIQAIGYLLIPLGVFFLFKDIKYLVFLTIFFAGFTDTSIYNFGKLFGLQPAYYFALLFLVKYIIIVFKRGKLYKPSKYLSIFIFICILSMVLLFVEGDRNILILNQKDIYTNVIFNTQNITQLFNILFCFIFYWLLKDYFNNEPQRINSAIKVFVYSTIVICLLGFYQEVSYAKGWEFDKFFRNGIHGNIQPFGSFIRVYSTASEPSTYAYFLAPILAMLFSLPKNIVKHKFLVILLVIVSGILSTSTTFIIGVFAFLIKIMLDRIISFFKLSKNRNQKIGFILPITILIMIPIVLVVINSNDNIRQLFTGVIDKLQGNGVSGSERLLAFNVQLNAAFKYPLLGVGYGSARSKDLFSTWLCNIGFIGTGIFIFYLYNVITKLKNTNKLGYGLSNYIFVLFVCAFISVPEPYFLFIWIMLSIGESLIIQKKKKLTCTRIDEHI